MARQTQLSLRLHQDLRELIGSAEPGDRLPSEPKLAKRFGVSRATLREAMRTFETQGLIQRQQGVGTFVTRPSGVMDAGLEVLESIETLAERIELPVHMGDYEIDHRSADENEESLLGSADVLEVTRVIEAEDRPVAYLVDVLAEGQLRQRELQVDFTGSVLDLLLRRGKPPLASSETEIHAVAAEPRVARALRIQRGDVVLNFRATLYAEDGSVVDLSQSYFLPGYFRFRVIRRVGGDAVIT
jgi:GntR family transcriptional regulator